VASETVPTGYLECNGAAVSRTAYADLFAVIGVAHGYGDNSTTFNLPDYRGMFLRGWDHNRALDPDRSSRTAMATGGLTGDHVGSVQADEFKAHTHAVPKAASVVVGSEYSGGVSGTSASGSAGGNETRPVNAYVMFCIKY
jgi:microcystin-dependent protein